MIDAMSLDDEMRNNAVSMDWEAVQAASEEDPMEISTIEEATKKALEGTQVPGFHDKLNPNLITPAPSSADRVTKVASDFGVHPGVYIMDAVLGHETINNSRLQKIESQVSEYMKTTDELLALSKELTSLSKEEKVELSKELKAKLEALKAKGIDLIDTNLKTLTKDQLSEIKETLGSHQTQLRTKVQQAFTKMQNIVQNMMSVNDMGKRFANDLVQFIRTIVRNMRP